MDKPKKVSLGFIRLMGGELASKLTVSRENATQKLLEAYMALGYDIDFSDSASSTTAELDFATKTKPDLDKTQPFAPITRPRLEHPLQS